MKSREVVLKKIEARNSSGPRPGATQAVGANLLKATRAFRAAGGAPVSQGPLHVSMFNYKPEQRKSLVSIFSDFLKPMSHIGLGTE